ncbi:hypothetical protein ACFL1T_03710 [Chlamydiota bacterium]
MSEYHFKETTFYVIITIMKKISLFLSVLIIFFLSICYGEVYIDKEKKYQIDMPQKWIKKGLRYADGKVYFKLDSEDSYFSIFSIPFEHTASWAAYGFVEGLKKDETILYIREKIEKMRDYITSRVEYIYHKNEKKYHARISLIYGKNVIYVLMFHAQRKNYPLFIDTIKDSFLTFELLQESIEEKLEKKYSNKEFSFSFLYPTPWMINNDYYEKDVLIAFLLAPDIRIVVSTVMVEYMQESTGLLVSADREKIAQNEGVLIKATVKNILKTIRKNNKKVKKIREFVSKIDTHLAMELLVEYDQKPESSNDKKIVYKKEDYIKVREKYVITTAGANIITIGYYAPVDKFNFFITDFERVIETFSIDVKE